MLQLERWEAAAERRLADSEAHDVQQDQQLADHRERLEQHAEQLADHEERLRSMRDQISRMQDDAAELRAMVRELSGRDPNAVPADVEEDLTRGLSTNGTLGWARDAVLSWLTSGTTDTDGVCASLVVGAGRGVLQVLLLFLGPVQVPARIALMLLASVATELVDDLLQPVVAAVCE